MTDWPDNLIDAMARASYAHNEPDGDWVEDLTTAERREWRDDAAASLAALAEWCDGDLYDPTTGQRIQKRHVCDGDWDDDGDEDQYQQSFPFACNWTDAAGEMNAGVPLFTLSPREDQP